MRNQLVTCAAFPVSDDLLRTSQRHEWSLSRVLDCGLRWSLNGSFFFFLLSLSLSLQIIFQHAENRARDEICPNRNSLICQQRNDTRTRSCWKVALVFAAMEQHRPLLEKSSDASPRNLMVCVVPAISNGKCKYIFFLCENNFYA